MPASKPNNDWISEVRRLLGGLLEYSPDAVLVVDEDGRIVTVNAHAERMLGYTADELAGASHESLVPDRIRAGHGLRAASYLAAPELRPMGSGLDLYARRRDGSEFPVEISLTPAPVSGKRVIVCVMRDISERRRFEEEIRRSEETHRAQVRSALYGIYRSSAESGRFLSVNPALVEMLGYDSEDELLALDVARDVYKDPEERARLMERYRDSERVLGVDVEWKRKDGSVITVRLSGRPARVVSGAVTFEMIAEDVTERRSLEEQLRQAQKMEAVGQLAGGIAHDFNNLLTTIIMAAEFAQAELAVQHPQRGDIETILEASRSAADLTGKLLAFGRRRTLERKPVRLVDAIESFLKMTRRVVREDIRIATLWRRPDVVVNADANAIGQILMNLVTNARDAMAEGGAIDIVLDEALLDEEFCRRHGWGTPGEYARLSVTDTGIGMDAETQRRIFEPFFSTKALGTGTGLGMAMVYGLVKQHEGFVHVYSEPGHGTAVAVYLPVVSTDPVPRRSVETATLTGTETVLVVEDEPTLRQAARRVLTRHGYKVLLAADGQDALELFGKRAADINLVVTDVIMPRMGGPALVAELLRLKPGVRVLMTSGYAAREGPPGTELEGVPFLPKPWTITDFLTAVRRALDAPGGG